MTAIIKASMSSVLVAFVVVSVAGCSTTVGRVISPEKVVSIIPGATTKADVLERLGAPMAVVERDEVVTIPTPRGPKMLSSEDRFPDPSYRVRADTFFTLFPDAKDGYKVYYYHYGVSRLHIIFLVLYMGQYGKTTTDRLWILVNDRTGIVENYAYKRYGENVTFAKSP